MQLIIALETKNKEGSDYIYLRAIRQRFYFDRGVKITPVFMDGMGNYKNISSKIDKAKKEYKAGSPSGGESTVIYFVDVDSDAINYDQSKLNEEITEYCNANDIELVWFKRDVEEVLLGERVDSKLKTQRAKNFLAQNKINGLDENDMCINASKLKNGQSNVLDVLDQYLERKK